MAEGGSENLVEYGPLDYFKQFYSTCLLVFSLAIVMGLIFTEQTNFSQQIHPALAVILLWVCILWLSVVEGGQASFVGLAPVDRELYKESHPYCYRESLACHTGDNLDRYLMGRQFMVIFIAFIINNSGAPVGGAELWGLPKFITDIFLVTGFAMILFTAMIGQLQSQVNASLCMLDYANNWYNLYTLYVARAIEFSGFMHVSYLIQIVIGQLAGKPIQSNEEPKTGGVLYFFWGRVIFSAFVLTMCLVVTLGALFAGRTTMWDGVPEAVAVILFFLLMSVVGLLEGMQIAFFAVAKIKAEDRGSSVFARKTCELLFKGDGKNLPGFMVGRQLCVVSCFFIIARVTTITAGEEGDGNILGVSDGLQAFFETGLCGAVITTILGSITWQLVASAFPIATLSIPFTYIFLVICLALEATGIASGAWFLASILKRVQGMQRDEVYIGTPEEREAQKMGDESERLHVGPGHPRKLPVFTQNAPNSLKKLITEDPSVIEYISAHVTEEVDEEAPAADEESEMTEVDGPVAPAGDATEASVQA